MKRVDRIQLSYNLTFTMPFHCGTGLRVGLIDRTIVRDHDGYLYVPGSTIKGVLREQCEQLARLYEVLDEEMQELIASPHDKEKALWMQGCPHTMVTRIFGSHSSPGLLFFDDARQTNSAKRQYDSKERGSKGKGKYKDTQIDLYTRVRLDRPTRTAARGALYTSEVGSKDLSFEGHITGWLSCTPIEGLKDDPTYSLLLLLAGIHLLDRIGGNKSAGKGQCRCEITTFKRGDTLYEEEQWKLWLDDLEKVSYYSTYGISQEVER